MTHSSDRAPLTVAKKKLIQVHTCTTSKRVELQFATKPDQPGLSSLIRSEVIKDKRKIQVGRGFPIGYQKGIKNCVRMHIASRRIELESPGWSGFVENSKPDQT